MNIYFSGIGGVGIGPLAEIAHDAGYNVTGSDLSESLITQELKKKNISINIGQDGTFLRKQNNINPIDLFVYTSALPLTHPELVLAKELGIKTAKRDELLATIINDKKLKLIAIAGTHGKTTTTGMFVWAMKQLGLPVSYSIGTTISFGPSGSFNPQSKYFVYECDEFDKNFLHFSPFLSIIPSVDYDHPDTYPTVEDYNNAFKQFTSQSNSTITWKGPTTDFLYDFGNIDFIDTNQVDNSIKLAGIHNRQNATLVSIALQKLGFKRQDIVQALSNFPGTDRRFEKIADGIYSDYGHHPIEIKSTLQMAKELSDNITLIYQPHQNIRQHSIKDQYKDAFLLANKIFWLPTYLSREDPSLSILTPKELISGIENKDIIKIADFNNELWGEIIAAKESGSLVLIMGAGQIDSWARNQLNF